MENDNNLSYQETRYLSEDPNKSVMSMGEWIVTLIVMLIPCVNIIMMIIWAFGNGNENRKNYCRANLIVSIAGTVLAIILYATVLAGIIASASNYF